MSEIVDIVIPVFNGQPYIETALKSCFEQTHSGLRVTVIDNASTDGTAEWIEQTHGGDSRLRLVRNSTNIGMTANIQKCFESIEHPYYCFLCADDRFLSPSALEEAIDILRKNISVGAIFSDLAYIDANDSLLANRRFHRSGPFDGRLVGRESIIQTRNLFGIPVLVRSTWVANTKPDATLPYAGDVDLAIRLAKKTRFYHIPKPLLGNRYHERNASRTLHRLSRAEFCEIARKRGYALSRKDFATMRFYSLKNVILRLAFLAYAKIRAENRERKSTRALTPGN